MTTKSTAKTTAKKTTKKAAKATKAAPKKVVETATPYEDVATKAQERYFSTLEQGQTVMLESFETVVDTMNRIGNRISDTVTEQIGDRVEISNIPGLNALPTSLPKLEIPSDLPSNLVDSYFEFANKALANQREFANKALAITTKS